MLTRQPTSYDSKPSLTCSAMTKYLLHKVTLQPSLMRQIIKDEWLETQVPSGLLPAMELDGKLIVESAEIMRILEETFPDYKPLLPPKGTKERQRADSLMRLERRLFSDWLSWLTTSWYALHIKLSCIQGALSRQASVIGGHS